jgi:hypothetical protein
MARTPDEYIVHILLDGGHREEVRIKGFKEINKLINDIFSGASGEFIQLPKNMENEYLIVRPHKVSGISVEAYFASSVGIDAP